MTTDKISNFINMSRRGGGIILLLIQSCNNPKDLIRFEFMKSEISYS